MNLQKFRTKDTQKKNCIEKLYNYITNQEGYILGLKLDVRTNYLASDQ